MRDARRRRVVVTGLGLVTPLGLDRETTWQGLVAGQCGVGPVTRFDATDFPTQIAAEVRGFDPLAHVSRREVGTLDLFQLYALAAALEACEDAGLDVARSPERVGVVFGVGLGGIGSMEHFHGLLRDRGPRRVSPFLVPMMIPNMAASMVSLRLGSRGPCEVVTTACASGAHAVVTACRWIESGVVDAVVAGGAEAAITPLTFAGFSAMRALSRRNSEPSRASRPFDQDRDGFVLGEGAGALVLEAATEAGPRGASVYAELAGWGSTADAFHMTQPEPEGRGQAACMLQALAQAGLTPAQVGYINAHGTATPQNDPAETAAIIRALGPEAGTRALVSSTKSMMGHLLGAAGAVEAAITALVLARGIVPPTINLDRPDPACGLAHVASVARAEVVEAAISNSFGFGGTNATLALRRWREEEEGSDESHHCQ